jgi:polysaccharide export outer membrane protein
MKKLTIFFSALFLALPILFSLSQTAVAADFKPVSPVEIVTDTPETVAPATPAKTKHKTDAKAESAPAEAPADVAAAVDSNYVIHAGDVLQITVWKEEGLDREVLVLPDGTITFPLIGSFVAQGMTPAKVQATIKSKLATLIPGASVAVLVKAALGHSVSVIGQVAKPGEFIMGHSMTVMQALSQAGGLTPYASESSISILRHVDGKETSIPFDYSDIIAGRHLENDIVLNPGDVVVVPTAGLF